MKFVPSAFLLLLPVLAAAAPVLAQKDASRPAAEGEAADRDGDGYESRAGRLLQQRLEKKEALEPERTTRTERVFLFIEERFLEAPDLPGSLLERTLPESESARLINLANLQYRQFSPLVGSVKRGSGLAAGAHFWLPRLGGSPVDISSTTAVSSQGYGFFGLRVGDLGREESPKVLAADFQYRYLPREQFFGIGPDSLRDDRSRYLMRETRLGGVLSYRFNRLTGVAVQGSLLRPEIGVGPAAHLPYTGQVFGPEQVPGLEVQPDFFRIRAGLYFDFRDRAGNPHRGGLVHFSISRYDDLGSDVYEFTRLSFDARHFLPLGSTQRILALRFWVSGDRTGAGKQVPFYYQESLGGSSTLRGFQEYRFRDTQLLFMSAEYRWEPAAALELALFYDLGKVYPWGTPLDFNNLERSVGGGVRFKAHSAFLLRIDVGTSSEGTRVMLSAGPSF